MISFLGACAGAALIGAIVYAISSIWAYKNAIDKEGAIVNDQLLHSWNRTVRKRNSSSHLRYTFISCEITQRWTATAIQREERTLWTIQETDQRERSGGQPFPLIWILRKGSSAPEPEKNFCTSEKKMKYARILQGSVCYYIDTVKNKWNTLESEVDKMVYLVIFGYIAAVAAGAALVLWYWMTAAHKRRKKQTTVTQNKKTIKGGNENVRFNCPYYNTDRNYRGRQRHWFCYRLHYRIMR